MAENHTCFTIAAGNSLERVQGTSYLDHGRVNFVIGPSQMTLAHHSFAHPLDFVLIDGPHGFPFPQIEYFHFYQKIRKNGMLVVDDIHIPTVRQMYDFLCDEKMWAHIENVSTTAFFHRTEAPMFDPYFDGWQAQQFNQRHFGDKAAMDIYSPGWRERISPPPGPILGEENATPAQGGTVGAGGRLQGEIDRLRAEVSALRSSTSWRVTAPLRAIFSAVRSEAKPPARGGHQ
jgi:hypothetical protein